MNSKSQLIHSPELAELIGIIFGDGYMNSYGYNHIVEIAGNSKDDYEFHKKYIIPLIKRLFQIKPSFRVRSDQNTLYTRITSKIITDLLLGLGVPKGKKINLSMPSWIKTNPLFFIPFIRGLFDTDGSIIIRKRKQHSISLSLKEESLIFDVKKSLEDLGYFITYNKEIRKDSRGFISTSHCIRINRKNQIIQFSEEIGSSNPYKLRRFNIIKKEKNMGTPGLS